MTSDVYYARADRCPDNDILKYAKPRNNADRSNSSSVNDAVSVAHTLAETLPTSPPPPQVRSHSMKPLSLEDELRLLEQEQSAPVAVAAVNHKPVHVLPTVKVEATEKKPKFSAREFRLAEEERTRKLAQVYRVMEEAAERLAASVSIKEEPKEEPRINKPTTPAPLPVLIPVDNDVVASSSTIAAEVAAAATAAGTTTTTTTTTASVAVHGKEEEEEIVDAQVVLVKTETVENGAQEQAVSSPSPTLTKRRSKSKKPKRLFNPHKELSEDEELPPPLSTTVEQQTPLSAADLRRAESAKKREEKQQVQQVLKTLASILNSLEEHEFTYQLRVVRHHVNQLAYVAKASAYMEKDSPEYVDFLFHLRKVEGHWSNYESLYRTYCDVYKLRILCDRRRRHREKPIEERFTAPGGVPLEVRERIERRRALKEAKKAANSTTATTTKTIGTNRKRAEPSKAKTSMKKAAAAAAAYIDSAAMDDDANEHGSDEDEENVSDDDGFIVDVADAPGDKAFSHKALHNAFQRVDNGDDEDAGAEFSRPSKIKVSNGNKRKRASAPEPKKKQVDLTNDDDEFDVEIANGIVVSNGHKENDDVNATAADDDDEEEEEVEVAVLPPNKRTKKAASAGAQTTTHLLPAPRIDVSEEPTARIYQHVFGSEFLRDTFYWTVRIVQQNAGCTLQEALEYVQEMYADSDGLTVLSTRTELAHMLMVLCRGDLVDRGLGLPSSTPSVADRESAREFAYFSRQRQIVRQEFSLRRTADMIKSNMHKGLSRPSFQRLLGMELLINSGCVLALDFGPQTLTRLPAAEDGSIPELTRVESMAIALLSPTKTARQQHAFVCRQLSQHLLPTSGFPDQVIDPELETPARLVAPRFTLLVSEVDARGREFHRSALCRVKDVPQAAARSAAAIVAKTTAATPKSNTKRVRIANDEDGDNDAPVQTEEEPLLAPAVSTAPIPAESAKKSVDKQQHSLLAQIYELQEKLEASTRENERLNEELRSVNRKRAQPTKKSGTGIVVRRKQLNNGNIIVVDRSVIIDDMSNSMRSLLPGMSLVPNAAFLDLLEMLSQAYRTPRDWEDMLIVLSEKTRNQDSNNSGLALPCNVQNAATAVVITSICDVDAKEWSGDELVERKADTTRPLSMRDLGIYMASITAAQYIEGNDEDDRVKAVYKTDMVVFHVLVQFLRLHEQLGTRVIGDAAVVSNVFVESAPGESQHERVTLERNEVLSPYTFTLPVLLRSFLLAMSRRYYRFIGLLREDSDQFIENAAEQFEHFYNAAPFPAHQQWMTTYLRDVRAGVQFTSTQHREFRKLMVPIMHALFPVLTTTPPVFDKKY